MFLSSIKPDRRITFSILIGMMLLSFSGCQYIPFNIPFLNNKPLSEKAPAEPRKKENDLRNIYIQNFSGQKVKEVQGIFFDAAREQSHFTFMELLPDSLDKLGVLRIDVTDYNIWEIDEEADISMGDPRPVKRRNAIVSMKVNLFEAQTGQRLVSRRFSQPFQQIYVGEEAIENRPDSSIELDRLTKMLIFNMLDSFLSKEEKIIVLRYEEGVSNDWVSKKIHDFGNRRIRKGIRFAEAGDLDEAIWIWKIYLFSPDKGEPEAVFYHNRAASYYNLGVAYQLKKEWWKAAEMFSAANRIKQRLKYAQAWGNNIQIWLEEQRSPAPVKKAPPIVKTAAKKVELLEEQKPPAAERIENSNQLLLKPRILWPLDPHLKQQERQENEKKQPKTVTNQAQDQQ